MATSPTAERRVKWAGLVVALIGFLLSRYIVVASIQGTGPLAFLVGQALFLVLGLALSAFGVALAVSTYEPAFVNTVARWCVLGAVTMLVVIGLTHLEGALTGVEPAPGRLASRVLIGGAVGGTLTGISAGRTRNRSRLLSRTANRLTVLNRLLRHEILNRVNVVRGYTAPSTAGTDRLGVIRESADRIAATIEDIGMLAEAGFDEVGAVDLDTVVEGAVDTARDRFPDATIEADPVPGDLAVRATDQLGTVIDHLIENAIQHAGDDVTVRVEVDPGPSVVRLRVADDGPGLPSAQRDLLERGRLPAYDDPSTGFGLTLVRLLLERFGAAAAVDVDDRGTTITIELARVHEETTPGRYGVTLPGLVTAGAASVVAGVGMGALFQALTGAIAVIGVLYGVESAVVGWLTHLFHSVVFGFVFAAMATRPRLRSMASRVTTCALAGIAWGVVLWLFAAGVVMPVWLRLVGVPAPVPNLQLPSLAAHVLWGFLLGAVYAGLGRVRSRVPTPRGTPTAPR